MILLGHIESDHDDDDNNVSDHDDDDNNIESDHDDDNKNVSERLLEGRQSLQEWQGWSE